MKNNTAALTNKLNEYLQYNKRDNGPLIESRARRLRYAVFRGFAALAPSAAQIESEAQASLSAGKGLKRHAGLSIRQEIARRKRSRKFLAVSFIFRNWRYKKEGQNKRVSQKSRSGRTIGRAIINTAGSRASVLIESILSGAVAMDRQHRITDKAIAGEIADMERYIVRKKQQEFEKIFKPLRTIHV